jgi:small subunit ribosomal protein S6
MFIIDPDTAEDDTNRLVETLQGVITTQGGTITKTEMMGRRRLAYEINHKNEGIYVLFETEGTGQEIAELERRMRVMDQIIRYITVRVDLDRRAAEKLNQRRIRKASKRPVKASASAGAMNAGGRAQKFIAPTPCARFRSAHDLRRRRRSGQRRRTLARACCAAALRHGTQHDLYARC